MGSQGNGPGTRANHGDIKVDRIHSFLHFRKTVEPVPMFGPDHVGKLGAGEKAAGGGDPGEGFCWNAMEDVQLGEFVKLCGDCLAKRGNHEPA